MIDWMNNYGAFDAKRFLGTIPMFRRGELHLSWLASFGNQPLTQGVDYLLIDSAVCLNSDSVQKKHVSGNKDIAVTYSTAVGTEVNVYLGKTGSSLPPFVLSKLTIAMSAFE